MKRMIGALMAVVFLITNTSALASAATAVPTAEENTSISWPADQALPAFGTPAGKLDGVYVRGQAFGIQALARTFQGVINRKEPRVLVFESLEPGSNRGDGYTMWPKNMNLQYALSPLDNLVKKYAAEIDGMIIYDESRPDTVNVATTLAGLYNCIVVTPAKAQTYQGYGLKVKMDLRTAIPADAATNVAIYTWLYDNYRPGNGKGNPSFNTRVIVGLNPEGHNASRDLALAMNAPVVWLNPKTTAEKNTLAKFTAENKKFDQDGSKGNPFFMGWWPDEDQGINWATEQGWPTVPSDNFENYTVYSGMSKEVNPPATPAKPELNNKIYVACVISDGDNIAYNENAMQVDHLWNDSNRGKVPLSWTISPALLDAAPQMLEHYYKTSTPNDCLVSGPNGIGYTRSSNGGVVVSNKWPSNEFAVNYGKMTNSYFERTNMNLVTIWRAITADHANAYSSAFPSLLGMTFMDRNSGSWGAAKPTLSFTDSNVPVMYQGSGASKKGLSLTENDGNPHNYDSAPHSVYDDLKKSAENFDPAKDDPRFFSFQFEAWQGEVSPSNFLGLMNRLNAEYPGKFEFVRLDQLAMLVNEFNGKPINAALQADASASGSDSGYGAAKAVDGTFAPKNGWKSSAKGDKWLTVDLGQRYNISRYTLKNAQTGYYAANLNTKDYKLQASNDGETWTDIDTVTGNTEDIVYRNASATARFVRVYITNPGADGVARIQDFEVYGTPVDTVKTELQAAISTAESLKQEDYSAATWKALQSALTEAKRVNGREATQKEVDTATAALKAAISKMGADKTALKTAISLAKAKTQSDYSSSSWSAMQAKLTQAETVYNDTAAKQPAVNTAEQELSAAIKALTTDKTALKAALASVGDQTQSDYSAASWKNYQTALTNANRVNNDANAKQSEIDGATKALLDAKKNLTTDKTDLEAAITKANGLAETDYLPATWSAMQEALEDARAVYADSNAKQSAIDAALASLNDAMGKLAADKTALKAAIEEASAKKESDYSKTSWQALKSALDRAKALDAQPNAKQSEIDAAVEALKRAVQGLGIDKSELEAAIDKAAGKKQEDYSEDSWNAMQEALKAAEKVNDAEAPVQSEIDAAAIKLTEALNALAPDKSALKDAIDQAAGLLESEYTAESWAQLQAKLSEARAMFAGTDAVQSQVDQMAKELQAAMDSLVKAPSDGTDPKNPSDNSDTPTPDKGKNPVTADLALGAAALLMTVSAGAFIASKKRRNIR